jgi:hypothetical protein
MLLLQPHGVAMFSLQSLSFKPLLLDWSVESNITYEYQQMQNETVFSEGSTDMLLSVKLWSTSSSCRRSSRVNVRFLHCLNLGAVPYLPAGIEISSSKGIHRLNMSPIRLCSRTGFKFATELHHETLLN